MAETTVIEAPPPTIAPPGTLNPLAIIDKAVAHNIGADELAKLVDLQERWSREQARKAFFAARVRVDRRIPAMLGKDAKGADGISYLSLEKIHRVIKPIYTSEGFSLAFHTEPSHLEKHYRVVCVMMHEDGHSERYAVDVAITYTGPKGGPIAMNDSQKSGNVLTYGQRYCEKYIFGISTGKEDDDCQWMFGNGGDNGETEGGLSVAQVRELNTLIEACEAAGYPVNLERFYRVFDVEDMNGMTAADFAKAKGMLEQKKAGK